jgi:hypothetical protein
MGKSNYTSLLLGAAALCAFSIPAAASSWLAPGATMGAPAGANPPPGPYFVNVATWGTADSSSNLAKAAEAPNFIWVPGWNFLGASYAAAIGDALLEGGITKPNALYLRGPFNPTINPITLSWNLGSGFFVSIGEQFYAPVNTQVTVATANVRSGAAFEQHVALSYLANDWIVSANAAWGLVTKDAAGVQTPDYLNLDWTIARTFGKWEFGVIGYGAWDVQTTSFNAASGRGQAIAVGGLIGYNFGPIDMTFEVSRQVITQGFTNYGPNDTRVWSTIVIPIWQPEPPASSKLVSAKY